MRVLRAWLLAALASTAFGPPASAQERVSFPSLDGEAAWPIVLTGYWFPAPTSPAPAIALFHGCGGVVDRRGRLSLWMRDYAALFNRAGFHALVVDSLTPRYEVEMCTQRIGVSRVTQANRRLDALGALAYLAERPDVYARRIGFVGWSNGGSTVLAATNLHHPSVAAARNRPAFAVAFYPGCEAELRRGYEPTAPLLMLLGGDDDWTPPEACRRLAEASAAPKPDVAVYAGAYHGFDSDAPVRLRKDVPSAKHRGDGSSWGVHVGGNPAALRDSRLRLMGFLADR